MAPLADTVELLVSEIVTNAVRASAEHARHQQDPVQPISVPTVRLWLTSNGHHLWDPDVRTPAPETAGLAAESGRGLLLVETLRHTFGERYPRLLEPAHAAAARSSSGQPYTTEARPSQLKVFEQSSCEL